MVSVSDNIFYIIQSFSFTIWILLEEIAWMKDGIWF